LGAAGKEKERKEGEGREGGMGLGCWGNDAMVVGVDADAAFQARLPMLAGAHGPCMQYKIS